MNAIHSILAVTTRNWNLQPPACANQDCYAARAA